MSDRDPGIASATVDWAARRKEVAFESLERLVAHVAGKTTDMAPAPMPLPKEVYIDPVRFAAEHEKLFLGQPVVAGLSCDIPEPGNLIVFDAAGPSILVSRVKMCTHRGAKLIEAHEPHAEHRSRITCPFHAWTFDTAGKLIGQPSKESFAGCEIGARNLIELPCAESRGLIFVRAGGGEPIDVDAHLGALGPVLDMIEMERAVPVKKGILLADSNWKFALDTYGESYHFAALHTSTIGQTHYSDIGIFSPFDRHHRIGFPDKSVATNVGKPAREWPTTEYGGVHYLFPNTIIFFGAIVPGVYFTQVFRLFPDGIGKTRCHFAVYAPFGILSEEYRVASAGYANLLTAPEGFHTVLGANEIAVQAVQRHIAAAIGMPLS